MFTMEPTTLLVWKNIIEKWEALGKALFWESIKELGGMIADNIRLRRFSNQIKIFSKAQKILTDKWINPKQVSLKVLTPLIELSWLEEEETLQEKWAKLTAHILEDNQDIIFQKKSMDILNNLSNRDIQILDILYEELLSKMNKKLEYRMDTWEKKGRQGELPTIAFYDPEEFDFSRNIRNSLFPELSADEFDSILSNLVSIWVLRWEVSAEWEWEKSDTDPRDTSLDITVYIYNTNNFVFTPIGFKLLKICK